VGGWSQSGSGRRALTVHSGGLKNKTVAASFIDHPANVVLRSMRTSSGSKKRVLLLSLAWFAFLQVVLAWLCLPLWLLVRWLGHRRQTAKQILIISMGGIGDDVLAIPFIKTLRRRYPGRTIILIIRPIAAGFAELLPGEVDRELPYRYGLTPTARFFEPLRALWFVARHGLAINTELAAVSNWGPDVCGAGFIAFFSRATRRIAFAAGVSAEKKARNCLYDTFYTSLRHAPAEIHEAKKLAILLQDDRKERVAFGTEVPDHNPTLLPVLERRSGTARMVLAPFTGHPRKNWPIDRWIAVTRELCLLHPEAEFVIIGGPDDGIAAEAITRACQRTRSLCGKLSFPEIVEAVRTSWVFVGGDTGLTHLAAYAQANIVVLFSHPIGGSPGHCSSPDRFGPIADPVTVIQPKPNPGCAVACEALKPCCILNISVREVALAVESALACSLSDTRPGSPKNYAVQ
jgi:ADP-heptose:LPS heptosyltransferase